jgi:hypothetical protein
VVERGWWWKVGSVFGLATVGGGGLSHFPVTGFLNDEFENENENENENEEVSLFWWVYEI